MCHEVHALIESWADARCDDLEQGPIDGLLATLRAHADTCEEAGRCAHNCDMNCSRMRYPEFRDQSLRVGSGVVESGRHTVVRLLEAFGDVLECQRCQRHPRPALLRSQRELRGLLG